MTSISFLSEYVIKPSHEVNPLSVPSHKASQLRLCFESSLQNKQGLSYLEISFPSFHIVWEF